MENNSKILVWGFMCLLPLLDLKWKRIYDGEGEPSQLAPVDIFVSTLDPLKEPPLVTANTVLSILAVDYPIDKVSCYVSDDGSAMLTFEALSETAEFLKLWVPKQLSLQSCGCPFQKAQY
ncbi:unnamed protein product [Trifolium pratense]|uniref:Uncharacterized protein n=1 Tax=Trifolium pratense TaxID=57577 RepID=A0ACB0J763_TRIPR|nr:unnamed protein product [Trifolium pratense]